MLPTHLVQIISGVIHVYKAAIVSGMSMSLHYC